MIRVYGASIRDLATEAATAHRVAMRTAMASVVARAMRTPKASTDASGLGSGTGTAKATPTPLPLTPYPRRSRHACGSLTARESAPDTVTATAARGDACASGEIEQEETTPCP